MSRTQLFDSAGQGRGLHSVESQFEPKRNQVLVTGTETQNHGVWKVANRTSAGTTIITTPVSGGGILLTDLIVSTDKTANSTVQLQFTDGSNTEIIALFDSANAPVSLSVSVSGLLKGWKDARLEMVTIQSVTATLMVGYVKTPTGLLFKEWDALR